MCGLASYDVSIWFLCLYHSPMYIVRLHSFFHLLDSLLVPFITYNDFSLALLSTGFFSHFFPHSNYSLFFIVITFSCGLLIPRLSLIVSCAVVCMFALQNYHLSLTIDIFVFFLHFCDFFSHGCSVYVFPPLSPK